MGKMWIAECGKLSSKMWNIDAELTEEQLQKHNWYNAELKKCGKT